MDISSTNGTVVFDRSDHPRGGKVVFVERDNGEISVSLYGQEGEIWDRLRFLSKYIEWCDNIDLEVEYSKAMDEFFREHYTESEWTLAALSIL